jgi:hypothetical protein
MGISVQKKPGNPEIDVKKTNLQGGKIVVYYPSMGFYAPWIDV